MDDDVQQQQLFLLFGSVWFVVVVLKFAFLFENTMYLRMFYWSPIIKTIRISSIPPKWVEQFDLIFSLVFRILFLALSFCFSHFCFCFHSMIWISIKHLFLFFSLSLSLDWIIYFDFVVVCSCFWVVLVDDLAIFNDV